MKVAVTTTGNTLDSPIDPRFGRAQKFAIVDTESDAIEIVDNTQNLNAVQGAGIQAGETIVRSGVKRVITGHCGPKAFRTLQAAGIEVITGASGTVGETVERFKAGELTSTDRPDVEGHWA